MKKQTGRVNYVWVLAGGYLVYLAAKTLSVVVNGESDAPMITVPFAIGYALLGAWLLHREWKAYRYGVEHKDDPDSWTEDAQLPEEETGELPAAGEEELEEIEEELEEIEEEEEQP